MLIDFLPEQVTYTLAWTKKGGQLPRRAQDDGQGTLTIRNVHPEDEGTYVCTGSNFFNIDTDEGRLIVTGTIMLSYFRRLKYMYQNDHGHSMALTEIKMKLFGNMLCSGL